MSKNGKKIGIAQMLGIPFSSICAGFNFCLVPLLQILVVFSPYNIHAFLDLMDLILRRLNLYYLLLSSWLLPKKEIYAQQNEKKKEEKARAAGRVDRGIELLGRVLVRMY